jgi:phage baseplate assembly protein W
VTTDTIGTGWGFPVGLSPTGGFGLASGTTKLEQSMRLILTTYPGERRMRPDFGSRLRDFVFQPPTTEVRAELAAEVDRALTRWEPRARIDRVRVEPDPERWSLLLIDIDYTVVDTDDRGSLVFPFHGLPDDEED